VRAPVERIVVASSDKAYGDHDELPYREEMPLLARYPYDVSKACTDLIARSYAATFELPVAVMRLANVFGGGDLNFSRLVPDTARALAEGRRPVVRSDGTPERDWIYVEDAAQAYATLIESEHLRHSLYNLGSGVNVPAREVIAAIRRAWPDATIVEGADPDPNPNLTPGRLRGPLRVERLPDELGFRPRWDIEAGIARYAGWITAGRGSLA
jgi:CDP-glucose 4,6-dehydratase